MQIFFLSIGCHFVLLKVSFALEKLLCFIRFHLLIVGLSACATGVLFRKLPPEPMHLRLSPTFFSSRFSVSGCRLRSLTHLELCFVQDKISGFVCILHVYIKLD